MHKLILLFVFIFPLDYVVGQVTNNQTTIVYERQFKGVIFSSDYKAGFNLGAEYLNKRFTPTRENIETFEQGFVEQLNFQENPFRISDPKRFFKKHKRQYLGYISNKGDSIVIA